MNRLSLLNLITKNIYKDIKEHLFTSLVIFLVLFILTSSLLLSNAIKRDIEKNIDLQSDFIVDRFAGGIKAQTPLKWVQKIEKIKGISHITPRIYGSYLIRGGTRNSYFDIVGVDLFDDESALVKKVAKGLNLKDFFKQDSMILSNSLKNFLQQNHYNSYYNFITTKGEIKRVNFDKTLDRESFIWDKRVAFMDSELAGNILGIKEGYCSDLKITISNSAERDNILSKLKSLFFDAKISTKKEIKRAYQKFYDFKSSIFLILFLLSTLAFVLILYQRYDSTLSKGSSEVAVYRMVGWSIRDIIKLKLYESLFLAFIIFMLSFIASYIYLFVFDAPLLSDIFLGEKNYYFKPHFKPFVDMQTIITVFVIFIIPYIASIIIPIWRVASRDIKEVLR